jgi:hypothetical protein
MKGSERKDSPVDLRLGRIVTAVVYLAVRGSRSVPNGKV